MVKLFECHPETGFLLYCDAKTGLKRLFLRMLVNSAELIGLVLRFDNQTRKIVVSQKFL
jgi:hypothetical protein